MSLHNRIVRLVCFVAGLAVILVASSLTSAKPTRSSNVKTAPPSSANTTTVLNLSDFGTVGNGVADDGPAFQRALDALAAAGGGTLFVPAGSYLIATPVFKDFSSVANASVNIQGVPSTTMPAPPTAQGQDLAAGLDLTSEIIPATGESQNALTLTNIHQLLVEHIGFTGRDVMTDAFITLYLLHIDQATIRHCEFYAISTFGLIPNHGGGNLVRAVDCDLSIELSVFLGCTANSGAYAPVVENVLWRKFNISNSIFLDYGLRAYFSKTGLGAPFSWINAGNAAPPTPDSPRREFVVRDTFLDEGGWVGISAFPRNWGPPGRIDLLYISGLKINVANMGTTGHLLFDIENLLIENSHYGWSHNAYAAIDINRTGNAILDKLTCIDHADRLRADEATGRLTVINSQYNGLDSLAQITTVLNTAPEEDPVQYVRQQFLSALGRQPDPAAHFYWSDILIRCAQASNCLNEKRSALTEYLNTNPQPNFSITGTVLDENGDPVSGVDVNLSGSQSVATTTDALGSFQVSNLPTSGTYTVAVSHRHYTFTTSSQTITLPPDNVAVSFNARLNRHSISGRITRANGTAVGGVAVQLNQSTIDPVTTDSNGNYSFPDVPAGQNYTVVPSLTDFLFSPPNITFNDLSVDKTADFGAVLTHVSIAGNVVDESGNPLSNVDVSLTGSQVGSQQTDSQGSFLFTSLPVSGTYTVAVNRRHYTFATSSQTFDQPADHRSVVFSGRLNRHSIGGRITRADGTAIGGVTVQLNQSAIAPVTTDSNGYYSFAELAAGQNYTVVPSSPDFDFTPGTSTLQDLSGDTTANFTGSLSHISIAGTVVDEIGNPLTGADVILSGSQSAAAVTDSQGAFQLSRLPVTGTYKVTVSKPHYSFATGSQTFIRPPDNLTVAFSARLNRHSISGRITRDNSTAISGATVQLAGTTVAPATTDSNGNYSFAELAAGQNYTIVPTSPDFDFTPGTSTLQDLSADTTANFTGNLSHVSIGGTVVDENGNPLTGADVILSGSQSASAVTDSQGAFQLSRLPVTGTYTVTVSKRHYSFATDTQSFVRPNDNTTVAFSAQLNCHSISGRMTRLDGTGVNGVTVQLTQSVATPVVTDSNGYYSFSQLPAGGTYTVVPGSTTLAFTPVSTTFNDLSGDETANFSGRLKPELLTTGVSQLAVALDSISFITQPFSIFNSLGLSSDELTRVSLFAKNLEQVDAPSQISVVAQDDEGHTYPLEIEYVGTVVGHSWLKQLNVKLSPNLPSGRCVQVRISAAGATSNNARICIASNGSSSTQTNQ